MIFTSKFNINMTDSIDCNNLAMALPAYDPLPPAYLDCLDNNNESDAESNSPPAYSCHVNLIGNFLYKKELDDPSRITAHRQWRRVEAELVGTALKIRTYIKGRTFPSTKTYTLQAADAGIAADYSRRSHVLRVRAEGEQFLLATTNAVTVVNWVERLNAAIAVSLALDDREDPKFRVLPLNRTPAPPGFRTEFRRKCREEWWQSKCERNWLARPLQFPEGQSPFLLPEAAPGEDVFAAPAHRMGTIAPARTSRTPRSGSITPTASPSASQNSLGSSRIVLVVESTSSGRSTPRTTSSTSTTSTTSSRIPSLSSLISVKIETPPYVPLKYDTSASPSPTTPMHPTTSLPALPTTTTPPAATTNMPRATLDYVRGCARALRYHSAWRPGLYVRDGKVHEIRDEATVAYAARVRRNRAKALAAHGTATAAVTAAAVRGTPAAAAAAAVTTTLEAESAVPVPVAG